MVVVTVVVIAVSFAGFGKRRRKLLRPIATR